MVNPTNPIEIAQTIRYIIDNPEESRNRGIKARKLAEQKYSWDTHGKNIQKTIMKAIQTFKWD